MMHTGPSLCQAIDAFVARRAMSLSRFGREALNDPAFVKRLMQGRDPRLGTVDRVLAYMGEAPLGPAFRREVRAFLEVTGIKVSEFGRGVTGNPSFGAWLLDGGSPRLATVTGARAWMAAQASPAERERMRASLGAACGAPAPTRPAPSGVQGKGDMQDMYMNTERAAALLGLSPRTLERYRWKGGGPVFHRFGNRVRYLVRDLEAWAAARRRASTSDTDGRGTDPSATVR